MLGPISWELPAGCTALVGANGAGKSTLLRLSAGLLAPTSGTVERTGGIGFLPQHVDFPWLVTGRDVIDHAVALSGATDGSQAAVAALASVDLAELAHRPARALSGGQQRRLGLAQVLAGAPDALLLDEPLNGLDPVQQDHLIAWIREKAVDLPILLATHDLDAAVEVAEHVVVLGDGSITYAGRLAGLGGSGGIRSGLRELLSRSAS